MPKILLVLACVCFTSSCFRWSPGTVSLVTDSVPPSFKISGERSMQWIWFQGPYPKPGKDTGSDRETILWKIRPPGFRDIKMDDVPLITYGQIPTGWEQELPNGGNSPVPLKDGFIYTVGVVPTRGAGPKMCILVEAGRARKYKGGPETCGPAE